jgi:hypothetical protein
MQKTVYADCRRGRERKMGLFLYVVMDKKEKNTVTIEEFVTIVEKRNQNIKSIYSLT